MNLLLDTHAFLWFLADDHKLSANAKSAIEEPGNQRWLSPISLLEIALKVRLGKLTLHARFADLFPRQLYVNDIHLLPITEAHVEPLTTLALHHRDPFGTPQGDIVLYWKSRMSPLFFLGPVQRHTLQTGEYT